MHAEDLVIDDGRQGQVVEYIRAISQDVHAASNCFAAPQTHLLTLFRNEQSVLLLPIKRGQIWIQTNRSWRILQRSMRYWPKPKPNPELHVGMSALK